MTAAEADIINALEFANDSDDALQRALDYVKARRAAERAKVLAMVITEPTTVFVIPPSPMKKPEPKKRAWGRLYIVGDQAHSIKEWSAISGIIGASIRSRLRRGLTMHQALKIEPQTAKAKKA